MRYPKAAWRPVIGLSNDPAITPVGVILHVDGGNSSSLFRYFNGLSGGVESHLFLTDKGTWEQYRDTEREADANYRGNSWVGFDGKRYGFISVETRGLADGTWNDTMLEELKAFLLWAHTTHGIPLRVAPGYHEAGVGYHVMFGAGPDTNSWSNATGKVCPGPNRIRQFREILVPWMASIVAAEAKPTAPQVDRVPDFPPFPLADGHYYGTLSPSPRCHSGFYAKDRAGIRVWQQRMSDRGWDITVDGKFGTESAAVAKAFQKRVGFEPSGRVGRGLWKLAFVAKSGVGS